MSFENSDLTLSEEQLQERHGRWQFLFSWTGVLFLGWVVYELTSQVTPAVTIFCCKFGWEDFRTALWLRRRDAIKVRGKILFWVFVVPGLWKIVIAAAILTMIIAFAFIAPNPQRFPQVQTEFLQAALTFGIGLFLANLAACYSFGLAIWHKQKIWIDGSIHIARRLNQWPPPVTGSKNETSNLIGGAIFGVALLPSTVLALALIPKGWNLGIIIVLVLIAFFTADYLKRNCVAARSDGCWPPLANDDANMDDL